MSNLLDLTIWQIEQAQDRRDFGAVHAHRRIERGLESIVFHDPADELPVVDELEAVT